MQNSMDLCTVSINLPLSLLAEMVVFVKVVEAGSFSEAARQLGTSPSAVSRSVARLEKALAIRLLQRTTRKLGLTDAGQEVFKRCNEMAGAAQAVMDLSGRFAREAEGLIRLSVPKAVGRYVIHPHMPEFLRRYPKVDVQLILEDRYVDLIDDNVDLSIRITDQPPPGLVGRQLFPIEHLLCATPQYLAGHGVPQQPEDLREHSCIYLGETPADARWKFRQGSKSVTVGVRGRYAANHTGVRLDVGAGCNPDPAGYCRYRVDDGYGGRCALHQPGSG